MMLLLLAGTNKNPRSIPLYVESSKSQASHSVVEQEEYIVSSPTSSIAKVGHLLASRD